MKPPYLYILPLLSTVLLLLSVTACRDAQVARTLALAESVMEEDPDSARRLLDGIDPSRLHRADVPLYAVLDAQSRHKLDLPAPSDSLLNIAVDRYTSHGPDSLLMKTLFYRAVGHRERGMWKPPLQTYYSHGNWQRRLTTATGKPRMRN